MRTRAVLAVCAAALLGSTAAAQQPWDTVISSAPPAQPAKRADPKPVAAAKKPERAPPAGPRAAAAPAAPLPATTSPLFTIRPAEWPPSPSPAPAAERVAPPQPPPRPLARVDEPVRRLETGSAEPRPAREYCTNIATAAADARFAWQKQQIADMEQELGKRVALLEEKTAELKKWVARRDEFSAKAHAQLLSIYARMRPDSAALQLAALEEESAAALISKLDPRISSAILNEMDPPKAARLTAIIGGAARVAPNTKAAAGDKKS